MTHSFNHLTPAFTENNIPIVFAVDRNYVFYLAVTIRSILANTSAANNYDIIILEEELSKEDKQLLISILQGKQQISLRFLNMRSSLDEFQNSFYLCSYFTKVIYYRLFISEVLPNFDKILYLDSDLIVEKDIAELFRIDLKDCYLAAGHEWFCLKPSFYWYLKGSLGIQNPTDYFISGQLLMNLKKIREDSLIQLFAEKIKSNQKFIAPDQDILNLVCGENISYLPAEWNVCWHWNFCFRPHFPREHRNVEKEYKEVQKNPALIHYASDKKPWNSPQLKLAERWWFYAEQLPFIDKIRIKALEDRFLFWQTKYDMVRYILPAGLETFLRTPFDFFRYTLFGFLRTLFHRVSGK